LEQLLYDGDPRLLRENVFRCEVQRLFWTPFHALGLAIAEVTSEHHPRFRMQLNGAVVAGFDAPAAAVAFLLVNYDDARFLRLLKGVSWTRGHAWSIFTKPTCNC